MQDYTKDFTKTYIFHKNSLTTHYARTFCNGECDTIHFYTEKKYTK